MDSLQLVEKDVEKILSKFSHIDKNIANNLQEIINNLNDVKKNIEEGTYSGQDLKSYLKKIKETISRLSSDHKDLHATVSKIGKTIDKNFMSDFHQLFAEGTFDSNSVKEIAQVINEHLLQHGLIDVAESLAEEAELSIKEFDKGPYLQLFFVLENLKKNDLIPAFDWVETHSEDLLRINSALEFKLHRHQFIEILRKGFDHQLEAIQYAQLLAPFARRFTKEIQVLMGSLLYLKQGLDNSPYAFILVEPVLEDIMDTFMKDACKLLGMPAESPLSTVIRVGCITLPPLLALKQMMNLRPLPMTWTVKEELPLEIEIGRECRYHSVFACPILRQHTTNSNPPMRLVCGHVVSRDALNKLASMNKWGQLHNHPSIKVKCPYCPVEQSPSDAKQIYF